MAIQQTYIPATPRSKAFKYYTSSATGGGGSSTTSIIQQPNTSVTPGVAINELETGNTVIKIAENTEDETVLDVTMGTRMSSLATSGSGTVVTNLAYDTSTGVLTQTKGTGSSLYQFRYHISDAVTLTNYNYAMYPITTSFSTLQGVVISVVFPTAGTFPVSAIVQIYNGTWYAVLQSNIEGSVTIPANTFLAALCWGY